MNDRYAKWIIFGFGFLCYLSFFAPKFRYDSLVYIETARSIVFDSDLNTYNENYYFTAPGWSDVTRRDLRKSKGKIISFMPAPEYTSQGYRFCFFPIGNTIFWVIPYFFMNKIFFFWETLRNNYHNSGYSLPYILSLSYWNILWWLVGLRIAFSLLQRFFSSLVSAFAIITILGAGNLLPFVFIDVCFSHSIDFCLVTTSLYFLIKSSEKMSKFGYFFWGVIIGFSIIIRYQEIVLLILPLFSFIYGLKDRLSSESGKGLNESIWAKYGLLIFGTAIMLGIQSVYWKIMHGQFIVSAKTMGTGNIPTFNPAKPQLLQMFFSEFHGLFAWMPLLLLAVVGFLCFVFKHRKFGIPILIIFLIEAYYNACRTEWWNLGFGVRRFTGYAVIFMLGSAFLLSLCNRPWKKWTAGLVVAIAVFWNVLFIAQFYRQQFHFEAKKTFNEIVEVRAPYQPPVYRWIGPRFQHVRPMMHNAAEWLKYDSLVGQALLDGFNSADSERIVKICSYFLIYWGLALLSGLIIRLWNSAIMISVVTGCIILIYSGLWILDYNTEMIRYFKIDNAKLTGEISQIRINKDSIFWGENETLNWSHHPEKVNMKESLTSKNIKFLCRDQSNRIQRVNYNSLLKRDFVKVTDSSVTCELPGEWRQFCCPVDDSFQFINSKRKLCVLKFPLAKANEKYNVLQLHNDGVRIVPKILSVWMEN